MKLTKKLLSLLLCGIMVVNGSAITAVAAEVEQDPVTQTEETKRRSEYISHFSEEIPSGASKSDYLSHKVSTRTGNVAWDKAAVDLTYGAMEDIVLNTIERMYGSEAEEFADFALDIIVGDVSTYIVEYAPDSTSMDYKCEIYINDDWSTTTSQYRMHRITYYFEGGDEYVRDVFETRSWI